MLDVRPKSSSTPAIFPARSPLVLEELAARLEALPAGTQVVAYCRGAYCVLAYDAVRELHRHGRQASRLADEMLEWRLEGRPVEPGAA